MRYFFSRTTLIQFSASLLLGAALAGCADNTGSVGGEPTAPTDPGAPAPVAVVGTIALGTDKNFIPTDDATAATLTATLQDTSNARMSGATITFASTTGSLSAASATTDEFGKATVTLTSGLADFSNRTAVVTASAGGTSASIPIDITGSTVKLAVTPGSSIQIGAGTLTADATVTNAALLGLANQMVRFSIGAASTGAGTLDTSTQWTNASGVTPQTTFTPTAAGTVVLAAEWLNSAGTVLATATSSIEVTPAAGVAFAVTNPATDPIGLTTGTTQLVTVTVPADIAGTAIANVRISATAGTLVGITQATASSSSIVQTPALGAVAATYTAPMNAGSASIQVDALDAAGAVLSTVSRTFVSSAPASSAARLIFGAEPTTVPPSSGGNIRTSTLRVQVQDPNYNAVGGAAVLFGLLATTGSGETVSPAVVITDSFGVATTTFSSGTASTVGDIYAQAKIVGAPACTFDPATADPSTELEPLCIAIPMKVSAAAVSITVGFGTVLEDAANTSQYKLPASVLVVDSNGGPVAGETVTLSAYPIYYRNGTISVARVWNGASYELMCGGPYDELRLVPTPPNDTSLDLYVYRKPDWAEAEDLNRNAILDPGEDTVGDGVLSTYDEDTNKDKKMLYWDTATDLVYLDEDTNNNGILDFSEDLNGNGVLDFGEDTPMSDTAYKALAIVGNNLLSPPHAAGGTVPQTVTTDKDGLATFYLQYPKSSAWFIKTEVTARVVVSGTESTARSSTMLPMSQVDADADNCPLARTATY